MLLAPCRALAADPEKLRSNVAATRQQLLAAGLTQKQFNALVLRSPLTVLLNPVEVATKLKNLKVRLADSLLHLVQPLSFHACACK
jgi:hypothetical protein